MTNRLNFKTDKEFQEAVLQEKAKGTPDIEIGNKYGVTFRYIERLITQSQGINVSTLKTSKKIKTFTPKSFKEEQNTIWSFKSRGSWATHSGEYRGNWSPYIPRNIILKYSEQGELVLDYFCGAGTTAVESKLLGRKCIALDINNKAIELSKTNLNFQIKQQLSLIEKRNCLKIYEPLLVLGDARNLSFLQNDSIDLICAHPPYANIINYTNSKDGDLSFCDINEFLNEMSKVAKESFRVLKPGRQCAILIGDTRRKKHIIPLGFKLINVYLNAGFRLKELVIKRQHNCKTTGFWYNNSVKYNFLLLAHEYLPIFEKPITSPTLNTKETKKECTSIIPFIENLPLKKNIDKLETTTVWMLSEKDFEKCLNKNLIDRYSNGDGALTVAFDSPSKIEPLSFDKKVKKKGLFFIKPPCLNSTLSKANIELYLQKINEVIKQDCLNKGGYLVIQIQDVRINGYMEPMAKKMLDMLMLNRNLWLREIIIVIHDSKNYQNDNLEEYLKIEHQYLLVYEKIGENK
ncbi:MAG: DNA methyltransferase [Planctomycetota bacterium]